MALQPRSLRNLTTVFRRDLKRSHPATGWEVLMGCRVIAADALMKIVRSVNWGIKRDEARHSAALRRTQLTMLRLRPRRQSLPPLPPSKPCVEVADPPAAALREVVALPPCLDANSTKQRVNVAVDLRPSSVQLGQHSPCTRTCPPPTSRSTSMCPSTHAPQPYLRAVLSAHRIPAPLYARELLHGHAASRSKAPFIRLHPDGTGELN